MPGDQTGGSDLLLQEQVGGEERNVRKRWEYGGRGSRKRDSVLLSHMTRDVRQEKARLPELRQEIHGL